MVGDRTGVNWEGQPAIQSIVTDITERKQAEEALRTSEERYRTLVEGSIQGLSIISEDGTRLFANAALADMLGYAHPQELIGRSVCDNIAPHDLERLMQYACARYRGEPAPMRFEYQGLRKDGSTVWLENVVTLITWGGQPAHLVTLVDMTERKRAEEERQRLEDQLRQSQKMEALGTLAGGIAHEFNNALSAILGFTDLTQRSLAPGSIAWANLQEVLKAGDRVKDLVQQILAFSRQSDQDREPLAVPVVVQEVLTLLRASLPTTIGMRQHITSDRGIVLTNRTQIYQIVMNLCTNAEYAMRETGGRLEIGVDTFEVDASFAACHCHLRPGPYVRVTVWDTGPGIAPDVLTRIFDPFFTTKNVGEGTGMGLAIVHGIVTSHSGAITVESARGEGATFAIYLPQIDETAVQETDPVEEEVQQGKGCVLFVDDEDMLARLGQSMLERLGYEVVARTSSVEALAAFQAMPQQFDLVITDQTMPHMTGEHLAVALRRIRPDIPIILCTGFSHIIDAEKAQAAGIDAFCMKPLVTRDLAVTIQQVLANRAR